MSNENKTSTPSLIKVHNFLGPGTDGGKYVSPSTYVQPSTIYKDGPTGIILQGPAVRGDLRMNDLKPYHVGYYDGNVVSYHGVSGGGIPMRGFRNVGIGNYGGAYRF
jgi:hypothetical protein